MSAEKGEGRPSTPYGIWWTRCLVLVVMMGARPAEAQMSVWQRAKGAQAEQLILAATERVLYGNGDERDMLRARAALVSLSRGSITSPILVLLLIRLRRELALSPSRNTEQLLGDLLTQELAPLLRSDVHLEAAHLRLSQGRAAEAEQHLSDALLVAWEPDTRLRLLTLRGWQRLARGRLEQAREDYEGAVRLDGDRRSLVQAQTGLALCFALLGHGERLDELSAQAFRQERSRATVSGSNVFGDLALDEALRAAASLVLAWGQATDWSTRDQERSDSLKLDVCHELAQVEFGAAAAQLNELWAHECARLSQQSSRSDGWTSD